MKDDDDDDDDAAAFNHVALYGLSSTGTALSTAKWKEHGLCTETLIDGKASQFISTYLHLCAGSCLFPYPASFVTIGRVIFLFIYALSQLTRV